MNAPREEVPNKVGRYQIVESIGFGAMGAVYKAFDPLIKRTIAIKTIRLAMMLEGLMSRWITPLA